MCVYRSGWFLWREMIGIYYPCTTGVQKSLNRLQMPWNSFIERCMSGFWPFLLKTISLTLTKLIKYAISGHPNTATHMFLASRQNDYNVLKVRWVLLFFPFLVSFFWWWKVFGFLLLKSFKNWWGICWFITEPCHREMIIVLRYLHLSVCQ